MRRVGSAGGLWLLQLLFSVSVASDFTGSRTALQVLDAAGDVKLDRVLAYYAVKCCLDRAGSWPMQVLHVLLPPVLCYILHSTSTRPDVRT